jgi:hypothetical protein
MEGGADALEMDDGDGFGNLDGLHYSRDAIEMRNEVLAGRNVAEFKFSLVRVPELYASLASRLGRSENDWHISSKRSINVFEIVTIEELAGLGLNALRISGGLAIGSSLCQTIPHINNVL